MELTSTLSWCPSCLQYHFQTHLDHDPEMLMCWACCALHAGNVTFIDLP